MGPDCDPKLVAWGGYDEGKPRVRLLLDSLRRRGALAAEINIDAWAGVEDKSVAGPGRLVEAAVRLIASYPGALLKLLRQPASTAILLPYPAIADIFIAWPVAALRGQKIVLDAFIPLHDTIVDDRAMVRRGGIGARLLWHVERLALRLADVVLVDTDQHGEFFVREFGVERSRVQTVLVGAEPLFSAAAAELKPEPELPVPANRPIILFYGQLIPLHGLTTILEAVRLTADDPFHWVIVGRGQQQPLVEKFVSEQAPVNMSWVPWVEYELLPALIRRSAVALGIFGTSDKAARVIPNKLFQVLAAGRPIITRESPALRQLAQDYPHTVITVAAGDGEALAGAVRRAMANSAGLCPLPPQAIEKLGPDTGVSALLDRLAEQVRKQRIAD